MLNLWTWDTEKRFPLVNNRYRYWASRGNFESQKAKMNVQKEKSIMCKHADFCEPWVTRPTGNV